MEPTNFDAIVEAVDLADVFRTLGPCRNTTHAVDEACDLLGIPLDTDRRTVRHLLEVRERGAELPTGRAA